MTKPKASDFLTAAMRARLLEGKPSKARNLAKRAMQQLEEEAEVLSLHLFDLIDELKTV